MPTTGADGGESDPPAPSSPRPRQDESIIVVSMADPLPLPQQVPHQEESIPSPALTVTSLANANDHHWEESAADRELRGWLIVLATLIASITYASGLSPPGGFEKVPLYSSRHNEPTTRTRIAEDDDGHVVVLVPVLRDINVPRYMFFYYSNTAAFALSLSLILLLASRNLRRLAKTRALEVLVALDVMALLVAYVAGSSFGLVELVVGAGLVLVVPTALVVMSSRHYGKYFWDEI